MGFSANGERFATGGTDGVVRVYATAGQKLLREQTFGSGVFSLSFHPQNPEMLLATSLGGNAFLWDMAKQGPEPLKGHERGLIFQGAFSSDGSLVATAAEDNTIRMWQVAQPQAEPVVLRGHASSVFSVSFHPERAWIASGSSDKTVRIWNIEPALYAIVGQGTAHQASSTGFVSVGEQSATEALAGEAEVLAERNGSELVWDDSREPPELRLEGGWFGSVNLGKPRDLLKPVDAAIAPRGDYVLVAPDHGRPLLYDIAFPDAPILVLGHTETEWAAVAFNDHRPVGITADGTRYTWAYLPDRRQLVFFSQLLLPRHDGRRVELGQNRLCSLGVVPFEQCSKSATLTASPTPSEHRPKSVHQG